MKVLILGRANVGKSSLFNRLIKKKRALVINEAGITRDLLKEKTDWWGREFEVIDSGGFPESGDTKELSLKILDKIKQALKEADIMIMVLDGRAGLHSEDSRILKTIRKTGKAFLLFVNKIDQPEKKDLLTAPFFQLGSDLVSGSCEKNYAVDEVIEWIISQIPDKDSALSQKPDTDSALSQKSDTDSRLSQKPDKDSAPSHQSGTDSRLSQKSGTDSALSHQSNTDSALSQKSHTDSRLSQAPEAANPLSSVKSDSGGKEALTRLFIIGRANSGKSLLCNQILQQDRMIVSSQPGTTLDRVTDFFSYKDQAYSLSDNPGSRRGRPKEREKISFAKSRSELTEADIALLVVDAGLGPGRQEARLVEMCLNKQKPVLLVVNKMDLLKGLSQEEKKQKQEEIKKTFHFYPDLPIVFVSAKTGYHKEKLFKMTESLKRKIQFRVSTSELNDFFMKVIRKAPSPVYGPSDVKFYYISQSRKQPPEFIAFANYPKGVTPAYKRFIINKIKDKWDLKGVPIAFHALPRR